MNLKNLSIGERIVLAAKLALQEHLELARAEAATKEVQNNETREVQE